MPRRAGQPERLPAPGPLLDAQRTVSLVRSRAAEWGIDPGRIGIIGFSAGGHLAIATATRFDERGYEPADAIDKVSCRPDFAVAVYPGYFLEQQPAGVEPDKSHLASYMRIPKTTPPIFLVHASDDPVAGSENSALFYLALKQEAANGEVIHTDDTPVKILSCLKEDREEEAERRATNTSGIVIKTAPARRQVQ